MLFILFLFFGFRLYILVNHLIMINVANKIQFKPILKQSYKLNLKPISKLENITIFTMPTKIKDKDILSMFKGLVMLLEEKAQQEQSEKYLNLKLKYNRLKYLYNKSRKVNQ